MLSLVDADIVCYRIGFTTENEELAIAKYRCDEMLDNILIETAATEFKLYLSDSKENNFRYQICPDYKANRTQPKPKWHQEIKEHLIVKWGAEFSYGMEADDSLGIAQRWDNMKLETADLNKEQFSTCICTIDKDLKQVPGLHYNFVKKEWAIVTEREGLRYFYAQILIGDVSDNIKGCKGIGPIKAERSLPISYESESDLFTAVHGLYRQQHKDWSDTQIAEHILRVGRLLKIRQQEEEKLWNPPFIPLSKQEVEPPVLSIPDKQVVVTPYMDQST